MIYSSEELTEPFWAEYAASASGRDPLAIQNSSVVIYAKMMVGITNVTNRVRYIGFYCWLLEIILKCTDLKGSVVEQLRYIRRGELLLAYMMVKEFPQVTGVSGSAFASRNLKPMISLINGADWNTQNDTRTLYWTFSGGVFGQYYSGVVRELGLINHPNGKLNIYTVTPSGKKLAQYFGENIPSEISGLFWDCIKRGTINEEQLPDISPFALHLIPQSSGEAGFYREMLLSHDDRKLEPTFNRQQTIRLLLKYLALQDEGTDYLPYLFLKENYRVHNKLEVLDDNAATYWYVYELNELLHVTLEHFHACLLWAIDSQPLPLEERLDWLVDQSETAFMGMGINSDTYTIADLLSTQKIEDTYVYFDLMNSAFRDRDFGFCLANAVRTLISIYSTCHSQLGQIKELCSGIAYNFNRTGYIVELISELITNHQSLTLNCYVRSTLLYVINLHLFSSYSKTRIGQALVHNYLIEDNLIWRVRETFPNRTTPRLQNAIQYLMDVGWIERIEKKLFITDSGSKLLSDEI